MEEHPDYPETANFTPFALRLIELVKQHPILYVKTPRTNKAFVEKVAIWQEISKALEAPVGKCKTKWRQIRDNYRRFARSTKDVKSKYNDERLNFLRDHQNEVYMMQEDEANPGEEEAEEYASVRPRKKRLADKIMEELSKERSDRFQLLKALTVDRQVGDKAETPVHAFFRSMADVVVGFPPCLVAETRLEVCSLVTAMELRSQAQRVPLVAKVRLPPNNTLQRLVVSTNRSLPLDKKSQPLHNVQTKNNIDV